MFYQQNPSWTRSGIESLKLHTSEPPPSHPIDPTKPTVVFFHSTFGSESTFVGQVRLITWPRGAAGAENETPPSQMSDARMRAAWNTVAIDERWHGRTEEICSTDYVGSADFDALKARRHGQDTGSPD